MRTETINIYQYSELSDAAKDRAYCNFRDGQDNHVWFDEQFDSLKRFLKWSDVEITNYEISHCGHSFINTNIPEDRSEEIRTMEVECRLLGLDEPDTEMELLGWFEQRQLVIVSLSPNYPEEQVKHWGNDELDQDIIHWWNEHLKEHPLDNIGALQAVVDGALAMMVADMEYQDSKEYFEECESDYGNEYLSDGTLH